MDDEGRHMKRILGVVGSPRRNGNTHVLVSKILEGATLAGAVAETLFLQDVMIQECDGCHACWSDRGCAKKDDMTGLYPKIIESDAIVFGTPVYWYGPTALMKAFVDRFVYFNGAANRPKIRGKTAAIAVPFEEGDEATADLVVRFFELSLQYLEMQLVGEVIVPGVTARGEVIDRPDHIRAALELGAKLARE